jgi:hypothetical protein
MGVPAGFPFNLVSLLCFEPAENILNGTGHYVMNARDPIGRRGAFVEHKGGISFTGLHRLLKYPVLLPEREDLLVDFRKVKLLIFREFLAHPVLSLQRYLKSHKDRGG